MSELIQFTNKGFYCPEGDFYIDPYRRVERALITHGHSDHAIYGHRSYLTHYRNIPILKTRLSKNINVQGVEYGEIINVNGLRITFFPAGHVVGSSQIKIEKDCESWVITGDYKIENDSISTPFTPIKCNNLVTETTFAQPIFQWDSQSSLFNDMQNWINSNKDKDLFSVITCYSLGRAQRILANVNINGKVFVDESIYKMNKAIESSGIKLPEYELCDYFKINPGDLLLSSHSIIKKALIPRHLYSLAEASGWMTIQNPRGINKKFILSDHADWNGINLTVKESEAERIFTTHGFTKSYTNWLRKKGLEAFDVDNYNDYINYEQPILEE